MTGDCEQTTALCTGNVCPVANDGKVGKLRQFSDSGIVKNSSMIPEDVPSLHCKDIQGPSAAR
jgi:hypothetical protein